QLSALSYFLCLYFFLPRFPLFSFIFFFSNYPAPTEIYTLSLHDALPISSNFRRSTAFLYSSSCSDVGTIKVLICRHSSSAKFSRDRKSTRLNSSHVKISYAVFCLKKKKKKTKVELNN